MSEHNPPAFPSGDKVAFPTATFEAGMTLRDWFATLLPEPSEVRIQNERHIDRARNPHNDAHKPRIRETAEIIAKLRYDDAAAMLKVRDALTNSEGGGE